jgi:hypothetical protein
MAKTHRDIEPRLRTFIEAQKIFFVATAPPKGHVNVSPKGMNAFRVLGPHHVAWLDVTGSGAETAAHLKASDRPLTVMFCAFDGSPLILRLYGRAKAHVRGTPGWTALMAHFTDLPGARQIVEVVVDRVQSSCGMAVPFFAYQGERTELVDWARNKGTEGLRAYWTEKNMTSIDGLPTGFDPAAMSKT